MDSNVKPVFDECFFKLCPHRDLSFRSYFCTSICLMHVLASLTVIISHYMVHNVMRK